MQRISDASFATSRLRPLPGSMPRDTQFRRHDLARFLHRHVFHQDAIFHETAHAVLCILVNFLGMLQIFQSTQTEQNLGYFIPHYFSLKTTSQQLETVLREEKFLEFSITPFQDGYSELFLIVCGWFLTPNQPKPQRFRTQSLVP